MTTDDAEKHPVFKRRPAASEESSIAERAAQELEDLKSDKQWTGVKPEGLDRRETASDERAGVARRESEEEPLARVQAMVPKSLRDDFLVATRRAGTTAQQTIAEFVRGYVDRR